MENTLPQTETHRVASRLQELCSTGRYMEALTELYGDDAVHVEAMEMPGTPRITKGKPALVKAAEQFAKTTKVYGGSVGTPLVNGDQFVCSMTMDCEHTEGPMAGKRMEMTEHCLYTVRQGKIVEAKFFYPTC
jgi:ketosteroid isomerase-like protein